MMKKILYISLLTILSVACQSQKEMVSVENTVNTVTLKQGQTCEIKFITNASTGFWWQWINEKDITVVDSIGDRYVNNAPAGLVGASCARYWQFEAIEKGTQTLKFVYARDKQEEAVKNREVTITVE